MNKGIVLNIHKRSFFSGLKFLVEKSETCRDYLYVHGWEFPNKYDKIPHYRKYVLALYRSKHGLCILTRITDKFGKFIMAYVPIVYEYILYKEGLILCDLLEAKIIRSIDLSIS